MSYHSDIFCKKEFRKLFSDEELNRIQLVSISPPCKTKNTLKKKGDLIKVFTSDFVAVVKLRPCVKSE